MLIVVQKQKEIGIDEIFCFDIIMIITINFCLKEQKIDSFQS